MARRFPKVALDVQQADRRLRGGRPRQVLVVGELAVGRRVEVAERGAELTLAADTHQAFALLAARAFDVVVVDPFAPGHGLDLVTAVKEDEAGHHHTLATLYGLPSAAPFLRGARPPDPEVLAQARARHRLTPFIVLPVSGEGEYAIVVLPPDASFVEDPRRLPLVTAILSVDASRLLAKAGPMA